MISVFDEGLGYFNSQWPNSLKLLKIIQKSQSWFYSLVIYTHWSYSVLFWNICVKKQTKLLGFLLLQGVGNKPVLCMI